MNNSSNNERENREEELEFELSEIQTYDVTFVEKSKGKSKVDEIRAKGKAKGKDKIRGKGKGLAKLKGEYKFSPRTITVEMDEEDIKELAKDPNVVNIEPDILLEPDAVYSEPFHEYTDWMLEKVGAKTAYANGISGQGVKVAVLDSGVDTDNPMLVHAIKGGASVVSWSNDYEDITGHGTNVAGTIAGKYQGKPYGVAPDVDLYAVKITASATQGGAYVSDIAKGVEWAINNNMQAINISFQASGATSAFTTAINKAYSLGIPIFNSAGNDNEDIDAMKIKETRCKEDGVYCVLALDKGDELATFSAFGEDGVAFSTYGNNVPVVSVNNPNPAISSGTSFSSPLAMGIFALYKSKYPHLNGRQIIDLMKTNGRNLSAHSVVSVANSPMYVNNAVLNPPATPLAPVLTLLSVTGDTAVVRATVSSASAPFNKLIIDNRWTPSTSDKVITIKNKTRSYDFVIQAPAFNTQYQSSAKVANESLESSWSNVLTFTTTSETSNMQPLRPILEYVNNNGLDVTYRAKVPASSPTFNKLAVDYFWTANDAVLNIPHTRTHEFTVTLPSYDTEYGIDVQAYNGATKGYFSKPCRLSVASENSIERPVNFKMSVVSVNGRTVKFRAVVSNNSPMMNRMAIYNSWNPDETVIITFPKTRVHEFTVESPDYNTAYDTKAYPYNGNISGFGFISEYTTGSVGGSQPTPVAPSTPTLSLISVSGKTATIRATVPSTSAEFNKLDLDYRWISGYPDQTLTMSNTRSYDFTVTAPDYNTTYQIDIKAYNGTLGSSWSNALSFTTGVEPVVAPSYPTLSLVSVNGKTITVRATVPNTSSTFNKLQFDYYWISGTSDKVITMTNTRSYDLTFVVPDYNTSYTLDAKAFNGELASNWSSKLTFTSGADNSIATPVAPSTPILSLVSVNGKQVTLNVTVPSTSGTFNKLQFDYRWISGSPDKIITMQDTRSYNFTFEAPAFNTQYQIDVIATNVIGTNNGLISKWSNVLTFTTGN